MYVDLFHTGLDAVAQAFDEACAQSELEGGRLSL
jgi:hypothetical protein